jgi:hypothetical protein
MIAIDPEKMAPGLNQIVENEGTHLPGVVYIWAKSGRIEHFPLSFDFGFFTRVSFLNKFFYHKHMQKCWRFQLPLN